MKQDERSAVNPRKSGARFSPGKAQRHDGSAERSAMKERREAQTGTADQADPVAAARAAGLRYVSDTLPGITRRRAGKAFSYRGPDGRLIQETYANKIYSAVIAGRMHSAIQITTAGSICAVLDMLADGSLRAAGFVKQEEISLDAFLANRFGHYYAQEQHGHRAAG